jgi:RHS repeat-associated protein
MGARFYASELGVWTSPDPLATPDPERLVTSDFAAANPYAYAKQSPVIAADRDGHFWHIAIGAAVGALVGGGVEAGRQYFTEGKVSDWGRVGAAAAGGGVAGAITAAVPTAGLASTLGANAGGNVIGGVTERIIASGGQTVGTLGDVAMDAAGSVVGDGVAKGVGAAVRKVAQSAAPARQSAAITGYYPPNNGFLGEPVRTTLQPGTMIDRVGGSGISRFFSPVGTPLGARALPPGAATHALRTFEVVKPVEVDAGRIAPAFGELGLGIQFRTTLTLGELLKDHIREITP